MTIDSPAQQARRFSGVERLYGAGALAAFRSAHVLVVGIGGVGSWTAEALARSGVGRLTLVDMDHVATSNINRQIHALDETLGMAKGDAMRRRIHAFAPQCRIERVDDFVTPDNWRTLVNTVGRLEPVQAVVDACDDFAAKLAMMEWARRPDVRQAVSFIAVGAAGGKTQAEKVAVADLRDTTHDPLLAKARYQLRRRHGLRAGKLLHVPCVYSAEPVRQVIEKKSGAVQSGGLNCAGYGSGVAVTAAFGMVAAGWILNAMAAGAASENDPTRLACSRVADG